MNFLLILIFLLLTSCASLHTPKTKETTYQTSYGIIKKGYTHEQVREILGNPHHISSYSNTDIWCYSFQEDIVIFVYFINGKVIEVREKRGKTSDEI